MGETNFSRNLKHLRLARGLSIRGLARRSGLSRSTITRFEKGAYEPRAASLVALARGLKVEPGELTVAGRTAVLSAKDAGITELLGIAQNLSPTRLEHVIEFATFQYRQQRHGRK